jgi:uncharacterized protein YndB with AHSA1/START domain
MKSDTQPLEGRSVTITRVFDAPRNLVWKALTDPAHLKHWWGPNGFTTPVCEVDVRPGGAMRVHMQGPDGTIYPMQGTYQEVVEPERLVSLQAPEGFEVLTTITLEEQGEKTKLTMHAVVVKATPESAWAIDGMEQGWTESLQRLEAYLKSV